MINIINSFFFKNNRLFDGVFIIFNFFIAGVVNSKTKRNYQNIIKNVWIFDIRFNIYIYNLLKGFMKTKDNNKIIRIEITLLII